MKNNEVFETKMRRFKRRLFGFNLTDGLIYKLFVYILLIAVSYVFLYPLLRMISLAMMSQSDIINPEVQWLPSSLSFNNLVVAARVMDIPTTLINSVWLSSLFAFAQLIVSTLTGYAFSQFEFKFKKFWFGMLLLSFIIPIPIVLIPRVMMFITTQEATGIQMIGSILPQLGLSIFGQGVKSAILILISYNFFKMIPSVLGEAARIDGANAWQVFWHIFVKISKPTLFTIFLFAFVWNWNETFVTTTFVRGSVPLLPVRLGMFTSVFDTIAPQAPTGAGSRLNEAFRMSGTLIAMAPLLILYLFVQKRFVEGIENTGITGE